MISKENAIQKLIVYLALLICILLSVIYATLLETNSIMNNIISLSKNVVPSIIGTLISFLAIYFFLSRKEIFVEHITSKVLTITTEQAYNIIKIHEGSIAGGVVRLIYKFLVSSEKDEIPINEENLNELKEQIRTTILEKRELLHKFYSPKGRLDNFIAEYYNPKINNDFNRISKVLCSDDSIQQKMDNVYDRLDQIQIQLRNDLEHKLRSKD
ncbi:conserved hypothetical protein, membrane [Candidatus Magnetomorum sp. HK-1]|nr:conserved hypothetical protein, membrane [Candidatus Magnetomorum sp. HK-1]